MMKTEYSQSQALSTEGGNSAGNVYYHDSGRSHEQ